MSPALSTDALTVDIRGLLGAEVGESRELDLELSRAELSDLSLDSAAVHVELIRIPEGILARLSGAAHVQLECDRCLEAFLLELPADSNEEFHSDPGEEQWPISREGGIDLTEPLRQTLVVAEPTHPLCAEDCPGLCLVCGVSLKDEHSHSEISTPKS